MSSDYLFVYGLLKRGYDNPARHALVCNADFIEHASFQGKLYQNPNYPGIVPSDHADDVVHGELYRMRETENTLAILDEFEGCGPNDAEPSEYIRAKCTVTLESGATVESWVYFYNHPLDTLEWVPSGDFNKSQASRDDLEAS